jgi:hypothetical protein
MKLDQLYREARNRLMLAETDLPETGQGENRHWLVLFLSMAGSAWVAVKLGQDVSFDVLNYHYYSGFAFLHKQFNYDFAAAQVQGFFNPLLHVFTYLMLAHLPSTATAALLGAFQGLNFYLVFQISQVLFRRWHGPYRNVLSLANAAAGVYGVISLMEVGTTFGDNLVSVFALTGTLLIFRWLSADRNRTRNFPVQLWVAGAALGVGCALKLTVAIYAAGAAVALPVVLLALRDRVRPLVAFYGGLAAGFVAAYGVWGFNLYRTYQNPVFPYLNNIFRSSLYALHNTMDARFMPRDWLQTLFYPFYFTRKNQWVSEIQFRDVRLALCYMAVVLLAGLGLWVLVKRVAGVSGRDSIRPHNLSLLFFALFFAISYAAWQQLFSIYRYLAVLELLAPTFLALTLAACLPNRRLSLGISLLLSLGICRSVIPADYGRQKFDDAFLRVKVPAIQDLDKSVVLMVSDEPTSWIIPSFPPSTRFVRISSNFIRPGQYPGLDEIARNLLDRYDAAHTLVYVSLPGEMGVARLDASFYGKALDDRSCLEIGSAAGNRGYLCRVAPVQEPRQQVPPSAFGKAPTFRKAGNVRLEVTPKVAVAGKDTVQYRVIGMTCRAVDLLYTLDGELMPPIRNWILGPRNSIRIFVGAGTRKGAYHIIGIRDSDAADGSVWIETDVNARIR